MITATKKALLCMVTFQLFISLFQLINEEKAEDKERQNETVSFMLQHQMRVIHHCNSRRSYERNNKRKRSCWMKTRSRYWWHRLVQKHFTDEDSLQNFRVSSSTFKFFRNRLKPFLQAKCNAVQDPATVEIKVAIALYKLASCAEYRVVANQFGTNKSVVHIYVFVKSYQNEVIYTVICGRK
jgi:hypothetical protein